MLMHAIAHGACTDTVHKSYSALEVGSGREKKSLAAPGTRTRVSIAPDFFSRTLCQLSYSCPEFKKKKKKEEIPLSCGDRH